MLEFAISMAGLVAFVYVLLNVWVWLNQTLLERQTSFQHSRIEAGTPDTGGMPVPYERPPLELVGPADSLEGGGGGGNFPSHDDPSRCEAGAPFFEEAEHLRAEADARMQAAGEIGEGHCQADFTNCTTEQIEALEDAKAELDHWDAVIAALNQEINVTIPGRQDDIREEIWVIDQELLFSVPPPEPAREAWLRNRRSALQNEFAWLNARYTAALGELNTATLEREGALTRFNNAVFFIDTGSARVQELIAEAKELYGRAEAQRELGEAACAGG